MRRHAALLIGASEYQIPGVPPLPFVAADLDRLALALKGCGFHVDLVRGHRQIGINLINGEVRGFLRRARRGDTLFILLSGHGVHSRGQDYLIPEDAHPEIDPFVSCCVAIDWKSELEETLAEHVVICIDACREGINQDSMSIANVRGWATQKVDAALHRKVAYVYACSPGQLALFVRPEDRGTENMEHGTDPDDSFSLFSRAMCDVLTQRQPLTLRGFQEAVQERVDELHRSYSKRGNPQQLRVITDGDSYDFPIVSVYSARKSPPLGKEQGSVRATRERTVDQRPKAVHPQYGKFRNAAPQAISQMHAVSPQTTSDSDATAPQSTIVDSSPLVREENLDDNPTPRTNVDPQPRIHRRQVLLGLAGVSVTTGIGSAIWPSSSKEKLRKSGRAFGEQLWKFTAHGAVDASPVVSDGMAYIASQDQNLYAVNTRTGQRKWRFPVLLGPEIAPPAAVGGMVYIGSYDKYLYAVDARTGKQRWKFLTENQIISPPIIHSGVVYIASRPGLMYAINAKTGKQLWRFTTGENVYDPNPSSVPPAVAGGLAYITAEAQDSWNIYAVDVKSGARKWKIPVYADALQLKVTASEGFLYFGGGLDATDLYAIEAITGKRKWVFTTDDFVNAPVVVDGMVYMGNESGIMFAIDARTGKQRWQARVGHEVVGDPSVDNDVVCFGVADYKDSGALSDTALYALDARTGKRHWEFHAGSMNPPALADGVVYITSGDSLYAVSA